MPATSLPPPYRMCTIVVVDDVAFVACNCLYFITRQNEPKQRKRERERGQRNKNEKDEETTAQGQSGAKKLERQKIWRWMHNRVRAQATSKYMIDAIFRMVNVAATRPPQLIVLVVAVVVVSSLLLLLTFGLRVDNFLEIEKAEPAFAWKQREQGRFDHRDIRDHKVGISLIHILYITCLIVCLADPTADLSRRFEMVFRYLEKCAHFADGSFYVIANVRVAWAIVCFLCEALSFVGGDIFWHMFPLSEIGRQTSAEDDASKSQKKKKHTN